MKFAAGKRHMLVQDPNAAVEAFAEASEALGKIYGETANQCGESYFYYGKALLDLARMEAGVIDNVLDGGKQNFQFFSREIKVVTSRIVVNRCIITNFCRQFPKLFQTPLPFLYP